MADPMDGFSEPLNDGLIVVEGDGGRFTPEAREELRATLDAFAEARSRAMVAARTMWVG